MKKLTMCITSIAMVLSLTTTAAFAEDNTTHTQDMKQADSEQLGIEVGVAQSLGFFYTTTTLNGEFELIGPKQKNTNGLTLDAVMGLGLRVSNKIEPEARLGVEVGYKLINPQITSYDVAPTITGVTTGLYLNGVYNPTLQEEFFGSPQNTYIHLVASHAGVFVDVGTKQDFIITLGIGAEMRLWASELQQYDMPFRKNVSLLGDSGWRGANAMIQVGKRF